MNPKDFFENKFASKIKEDPDVLSGAGIRTQSVSIDIDGSGGGKWTFTFDGNGKVSMEAGLLPESVCTIAMKDETFEGMINGKVNIPFAVITRKIKIKGETAIAAKIGIALQKAFLN